MRKVSSRRTGKNRWFRVFVCVFVVAVVWSAVEILQLRLDIYKQRQVLDELTTQCLDQQAANQDVENYLSMHDDTELIEKIAREKLGFAYPDETVFYDAAGN